ncbi:MAG: hypothetical protein HC832_02700 [Leptolyngbyaceae cyanobacterium RM1_405_57]|nr:hypothetical protein [Leptolyngbyaceae cyanobacterium RM1_405_57]
MDSEIGPKSLPECYALTGDIATSQTSTENQGFQDSLMNNHIDERSPIRFT